MDELSVLKRLFEIVTKYYQEQRKGKFLDYKSPEELGELLDLNEPAQLENYCEILTWVEKYLQYSNKTHHPMFVNRMWTGANLPSIIGEVVTAISNTSACTYESAPVSTLIEKYMIEEMLRLVGFENGEGQMTTGSSNANMIAMMIARNCANDSIKQIGLFGERKLFGFVSLDAHYSMDKAANILGIGVEQLIKIPPGKMGGMDMNVLEKALEKVVLSGGSPFFVTATAGTTVRGGYDSIEEILLLKKKYDFWLHVDGAWGGAAVLSSTLRKKFLMGIEQVDSFTTDFHKMLGSALMCNIFLVNNRCHTLGKVLSGGDGSYLFRDENENYVEDLGSVSLQCGRRVDSLKWFLDWKYYGQEGLAKRVEKYYELCEYGEQLVLESSELELVVPRASFNICFRYKVDPGESDEFNLALRNTLYEEGACLVGVAYIDNSVILRLLITNQYMGKNDVELFFSTLIARGKRLLKERSQCS